MCCVWVCNMWLFNGVVFTQRLDWWRCWLLPSMLGSLTRLLSCRKGKLIFGSTRNAILLSNIQNIPLLQVSRVYFPLSWSPSCSGGVSRATQGGLSPGGRLHYTYPKKTNKLAINAQMNIVCHVSVCVFQTKAFFPSLRRPFAGSRCCFTYNTHT